MVFLCLVNTSKIRENENNLKIISFLLALYIINDIYLYSDNRKLSQTKKEAATRQYGKKIMKTLILLQPTNERNGILVKKTKNDINSCELRKVSISRRDQGYISSVNRNGTVVTTGLSWRGKLANSPIEMNKVFELVEKNMDKIIEIINE